MRGVHMGKLMRCLVVLCICLSFTYAVEGQPLKSYTVKDGRMLITLNKKISDASLDSFIAQYELFDLDLKTFLKSSKPDSLRKLGWDVQVNNGVVCVLSKPLMGVENIFNPAEKIIFSKNEGKDLAAEFPVVSSSVKYGYNRFKNKYPFRVNDSIVTFFLRGNLNARRVNLSGSFVNWVPDALVMTKTDSGWIYLVKLAPGKYWYKFVVDGSWTIDKDNRWVENDGRGNDNSVYFKTNTVFSLNGFNKVKRLYLSGSFNNWRPRELLMTQTATGWVLPLYLADGTHTYRFAADNHWFADPGNPNRYPNEFGEFNSVLNIGKPYIFHLNGYTEARQVILSGSFNGWRRDELYMTKTDKGWQLPYVLGPGNYEYNFIVDGKVAKTNIGNGNLNFVIQPNYTFRLKGFEYAKNVFLAGDFNGWSPDAFLMKKEGNDWVLAVHLDPGKHLYKFVVDGKWIIDPGNKLWEQNEHGTGNSVVWIEKP
jgi:hypothetical protein